MGAIMVRKTTKDKIIDYISYFFIYSCLGWIIQTIYAFIINQKNVWKAITKIFNSNSFIYIV